jgi:(p)ppGpp synthase/HD superfamily hydrolase
MARYAQTNLQLYSQLCQEGYTNRDLTSIVHAHELATRLFTCLYRPSGKVFIAHLIGTASILASLHTSVEAVSAGLIHSAYSEGQFGDGSKGVSRAKRKSVKRSVGPVIEEYVARYATLQWTPQSVPVIRKGLERMDLIDRTVLLIRLADELEDHLDLSALYCPDAGGRRAAIRELRCLKIEMAALLGFPTLAQDLARVFKETEEIEIPLELRKQAGPIRSFSIVPLSCRVRLSIALRCFLHRAVYYLRQHRIAMRIPRVYRRVREWINTYT